MKDPTVIVALIGLAGVVVTAAAGVVVAIITNRRETGGAAEAGVEKTSETLQVMIQRLAFANEQLEAERSENTELTSENVELRKENQKLNRLIGELNRKLEDLK